MAELQAYTAAAQSWEQGGVERQPQPVAMGMMARVEVSHDSSRTAGQADGEGDLGARRAMFEEDDDTAGMVMESAFMMSTVEAEEADEEG